MQEQEEQYYSTFCKEQLLSGVSQSKFSRKLFLIFPATNSGVAVSLSEP